MIKNQNRIGRFTSSQIYKLLLKGRGDKPSVQTVSYIEDVRLERRLGRPLNSVTSSRPTDWGTALEPHVASLLEKFAYVYQSNKTLVHPQIDTWAGTPDLVGAKTVADIKCPYTLKNFAKLADICSMNGNSEVKAVALKDQFPEYFWQLISNAVLTGKDWVELIVYCPYQEELEVIREELRNLDDTDLQTQFQWIYFSSDEKLPYLIKGSYYSNLNRLKFQVLESEKAALTKAVIAASEQIERTPKD